MSYDRSINVLVDIKPETGTLQIDSPITHGSKGHPRPQYSEENRGSMGQSGGHSSTSVVDQVRSPVDDAGVTSSSTICPAPVCRQFWKAGNYNDGLSSKSQNQNGKNYLHVHPMFLHSNATSHKWAFGAVAELLDNAVDEIQNGATFVIVDKTTNPRDGTTALLIQDDGGGMDPQAMRHCMGFGFSDKKSKSAIGRYGNGFKTSTMRLGADVIVFSRHMKNQIWTQSIGFLSYTYLTLTGHDRIVVPILDYEFKVSANKFETLQDPEQFRSSLSILLEWSPFSTEAELLQQFDDVGAHGTKVIIYNMWLNNDAKLELDFNSVAEDILIEGNITKTTCKIMNEHIASRFSYSLRVYLSILYLRIPETFKIELRGKVVEHHNIADDLNHPQYILYKPHAAGNAEAAVVTTIGFLKEAPKVNLHGFCVYHRNRLIMPFWQVVSGSNSRGRGVVGVLEANFVEPTHNKQDFEKTLLLQKLESRLKDMTLEYWDVHCALIGYQVAKKYRPQISQSVLPNGSTNENNIPKKFAGVIGRPAISPPPGFQAVTAPPGFQAISAPPGFQAISSAPPGFQAISAPPGFQAISAPPGFQTSIPRVVAEPVLLEKRKEHPDVAASPGSKRKVGNDVFTIPRQSPAEQFIHGSINPSKDPPEVVKLMEENKKLRAKCLDHKLRSQTLEIKAFALRTEIGNVNNEYDRLMAEVQALGIVKGEQSREL